MFLFLFFFFNFFSGYFFLSSRVIRHLDPIIGKSLKWNSKLLTRILKPMDGILWPLIVSLFSLFFLDSLTKFGSSRLDSIMIDVNQVQLFECWGSLVQVSVVVYRLQWSQFHSLAEGFNELAEFNEICFYFWCPFDWLSFRIGQKNESTDTIFMNLMKFEWRCSKKAARNSSKFGLLLDFNWRN